MKIQRLDFYAKKNADDHNTKVMAFLLNKTNKLSITLINLVLLINCDLLPNPEIYEPDYTPEISVFALISPDDNYEFVIVERTLQLKEESYWDETGYHEVDTIIKNATVTISGAEGTVEFKFLKKPSNDDPRSDNNQYKYKGMYLDIKNEFHAKPGKTYTLTVAVPDGRIVTGTARVPPLPEISAPVDNAIYPVLSILETEIIWDDDPHTVAYQVSFIFEEENPSFSRSIADSRMVLNPPVKPGKIWSEYNYFADPYGWYRNRMTIKVMAMDRNYYDYIRSNTELALEIGNTINSLKGGIGVFGAVNIDSVNIRW